MLLQLPSAKGFGAVLQLLIQLLRSRAGMQGAHSQLALSSRACSMAGWGSPQHCWNSGTHMALQVLMLLLSSNAPLLMPPVHGSGGFSAPHLTKPFPNKDPIFRYKMERKG